MKNSVIYLVIFGSLFVSYLSGEDNSALHYKSNSSLQEKLAHSNYNWKETKPVTADLTIPNYGIVNVRTINGEILYQGFWANDILSELILKIPQEIDQVLIEYEDNKKLVSEGAKKIRFTV